MSLQVDRFEIKEVSEDATLHVRREKSILIKDHTTDEIVVVVNIEPTTDLNKIVAEKIVESIEEYIINKD